MSLPHCVTMPSHFRKEEVAVNSTAHVHSLNVVWILAHLTARLRCAIFSNGKNIFEVENSSGLPFTDAYKLVTSKRNESILIRHSASTELGGVTLQRVDDERWLMDVIPAITRVRSVGEKKEVNHIARELFLSIKHATKLEDGINEQLVTYRQPIYYHPRFDTRDFDPSYFTVD